MRKVSGLLLTLILLSASAGCLAEEIQEELEKEEGEGSFDAKMTRSRIAETLERFLRTS